MEQLQPVPVAAVGIRPAGSGKVTVTAPSVGRLPVLLAVRV